MAFADGTRPRDGGGGGGSGGAGARDDKGRPVSAAAASSSRCGAAGIVGNDAGQLALRGCDLLQFTLTLLDDSKPCPMGIKDIEIIFGGESICTV